MHKNAKCVCNIDGSTLSSLSKKKKKDEDIVLPFYDTFNVFIL